MICGYGDVCNGSDIAVPGAGARVVIAECDPFCALRACMEGFVTTAGSFKIIRLEHMQKMRVEPQLLYKSNRCTLVSFV